MQLPFLVYLSLALEPPCSFASPSPFRLRLGVSMAFVSFLLVGKDVLCDSRTPLLQGEVFVFRPLLTDFLDSGDTIGIVLRENSTVPFAYDVKVLAVSSGFYRWHLIERQDAPAVHVLRLPRTSVEANIYQRGAVILENATRWRSLGRGDVIAWDLVP